MRSTLSSGFPLVARVIMGADVVPRPAVKGASLNTGRVLDRSAGARKFKAVRNPRGARKSCCWIYGLLARVLQKHFLLGNSACYSFVSFGNLWQHEERNGRFLTNNFTLQMMAEMLWTGVLVSAPILGLTIGWHPAGGHADPGMSLSFVPKIITAVLVLVAFGPWMLKKLVQFSVGLIGNIPSYF
jgi:flagellar biosynthetic protein FliQ